MELITVYFSYWLYILPVVNFFFAASAHTNEHGVDEYPDISGITTARVLFIFL